jgi:hypothetical protein
MGAFEPLSQEASKLLERLRERAALASNLRVVAVVDAGHPNVHPVPVANDDEFSSVVCHDVASAKSGKIPEIRPIQSG